MVLSFRVRFFLATALGLFLQRGFALEPSLLDEAKYKLEALKEAPPEGVGEKIREAFPSEGLRVLDKAGQPFADIWLRKSVPASEGKAEQGVKFGQIAEGTLLGVVRFHKPASDFKGNAFPAGVYTFRNGIQPRDGDHLGVSETRDFVLLSPVKVDTKLDPMTTKELIKLSVQVSGIKHPTVLYLMKMAEEGQKLPRLVEDADLAYWILDCQMEAADKTKGAVRLGIILVGKSAEK